MKLHDVNSSHAREELRGPHTLVCDYMLRRVPDPVCTCRFDFPVGNKRKLPVWCEATVQIEAGLDWHYAWDAIAQAMSQMQDTEDTIQFVCGDLDDDLIVDLNAGGKERPNLYRVRAGTLAEYFERKGLRPKGAILEKLRALENDDG